MIKNKNAIVIGVIVVILVTAFYGYNSSQYDRMVSDVSPYSLCDLDYDLDCDDGDVKIFESFLGTCLKQGDSYSSVVDVRSDVDSDNCITEQDKILLFGGLTQ